MSSYHLYISSFGLGERLIPLLPIGCPGSSTHAGVFDHICPARTVTNVESVSFMMNICR